MNYQPFSQGCHLFHTSMPFPMLILPPGLPPSLFPGNHLQEPLRSSSNCIFSVKPSLISSGQLINFSPKCSTLYHLWHYIIWIICVSPFHRWVLYRLERCLFITRTQHWVWVPGKVKKWSMPSTSLWFLIAHKRFRARQLGRHQQKGEKRSFKCSQNISWFLWLFPKKQYSSPKINPQALWPNPFTCW